ncbi:class F sortase [Candidatus Nephthysia bennettiae]|uniref:Class F sortase n=1 Tax=Candidatus Nephthysia bennettiae TaxID=3127016 RepID=A0A934K6H5_9BACT|nr:class F sortase [Candidatus Dormibacteraeota bacterium]
MAVLLLGSVAVGSGWLVVRALPAATLPHRTVHAEINDKVLFGKSVSAERPPLPPSTAARPARGPIEPARIEIPALHIDARVENVGLTRDWAMDVPSSIWDTAWLGTGPKPGAIGNAVIDGHKDSVKGPAVFMWLGKLRPSDRVLVTDASGAQLTFKVTEVASYDLASPPLERIFGPATVRQLNLITCDGPYDNRAHTYERRLVVFTKLE